MKRVSLLFLFSLVSLQLMAQELMWADRIGSGGNNYVYNVKVDPATDEIYATGRVKSGCTFGELSAAPSTPTDYGDRDIYLTKHDSEGELIWVKRFGGLYTDYGQCIEISDDHIYLSGYLTDTCFIDDDTLISNGEQDAVVIKLEKNGDVVWAKSWGGLGNDKIIESYLDEDGNLFFTGYYVDSISFDGINLINTIPTFYVNRESAFVMRTDTAANVIWANNVQSTHGVRNEDIIAKDGYLYVIGNCYGTTEFGGAGIPSVNLVYFDQFLAKYDTLGNYIWANLYGNNWNDTFTNIDQDEENIYITGFFKGVVNYGPETFDAPVERGIGLKLDTSGAVLTAYEPNSTGIGALDGLVYDDGRMFMGGYFTDTLFVLNDTLVSAGDKDIIMIEFDTSLIPVDYYTEGGISTDQIRAMDITSEDNVVLAGSFRQTVDFGPVTFTALVNTYDGLVSSYCSPIKPALFAADSSVCVGDTIKIMNTTKGYLSAVDWQIEGGTICYSSGDSIGIKFDTEGEYDLKVLMESNCSMDSIEFVGIQINPLPSVSLGDDLEACEPHTFLIEAVGDYDSIVWSTGTIDESSIEVNETTTVLATVWYDTGCGSEDTVLVTIKDCSGIEEDKLDGIENVVYSEGELILIFSNNVPVEMTYEMMDISGKLVQYGVSYDTKIAIEKQLQTGIYILKLNQGNNYKTFKLKIP